MAYKKEETRKLTGAPDHPVKTAAEMVISPALAERRNIEELRALFELAGCGAAQLDPVALRFLRVNAKMCQMLGATEAEALGMDLLQVTHPAERESSAQELQKLLRGEIKNVVAERRLTHKDGRVVWTQLAAACLRTAEGRPRRLVAVIQDISERKRTEEALLAANERLAEADRHKDEFLAMLAHELRNPLEPIRNAVQVLRLAGPQAPTLQHEEEMIDRQVNHLARLLDDLLDVSRVTHGRIELQKRPLELAEVITHAAQIITPLIEARCQTLAVAPPPASLRVEADADRLTQIVDNLLANAAKFTGEGGRIWLEASREGEEAVIRVRDTGVGIAPELAPRIFDLFVQANQGLAHTQGGLGIGLTLARRLAQMHGGTIEVHSAGLGRGSEFVVRLPALPAQAPAPAVPEAEVCAVRLAPHRILVVDDMVDSAESLAELLSLSGHEVRIAHDGPAALEAARAFQPEVALLDIGMPGMDGYEVARRLRREHADRPLLLVALTGFGQESDRQAARDAGFDHHLVKPVDLSALFELLDCAVA